MSWEDLHARAQDLSSEAQLKHSGGDRGAARKLYSKAADLESQAYNAVTPTKVRTRSITAVSAAALLFKAKRLDEAERFLFRALAADDILPPQRTQLRELPEAVTDEQALPVTKVIGVCYECGGATVYGRCRRGHEGDRAHDGGIKMTRTKIDGRAKNGRPATGDSEAKVLVSGPRELLEAVALKSKQLGVSTRAGWRLAAINWLASTGEQNESI